MPYKDPNGSKKEPSKKTPKKQSQHSTMSRVANASKLREGQQQDKSMEMLRRQRLSVELSLLGLL